MGLDFQFLRRFFPVNINLISERNNRVRAILGKNHPSSLKSNKGVTMTKDEGVKSLVDSWDMN